MSEQPRELQQANPQFTAEHAGQLKSAQGDVDDLKRAVFGDKKLKHVGLQERVEKLEEGLLTKILRHQKILMWLVGGIVVLLGWIITMLLGYPTS